MLLARLSLPSIPHVIFVQSRTRQAKKNRKRSTYSTALGDVILKMPYEYSMLKLSKINTALGLLMPTNNIV